MKKNNNMTKYIRIVIALVLIVGLGFIVKDFVFGQGKNAVAGGKIVNLDNTYTFKARNSSNQITTQVVDLTYTAVHKETEVLVKGQKATARNGKSFLLFDVAITNNTDYVLYLDLIDLIRLVESEDVKLSPQVHQGLLEVRPQSTKVSNVGFVVPENQRKFTLQVGELREDKETFEVTL